MVSKLMVTADILCCLVMAVYVRTRYSRSIMERLEVSRTHKEFRLLGIELRTEYAAIKRFKTPLQRFLMPPCEPELKRLEEGQFPGILTSIRQVYAPLSIGQVIVLVLGNGMRSTFLLYCAAMLFAAMVIMLIIFISTDRTTLPGRKIPRKKAKKQSRWKYNEKQKRPYTAQEKQVIRTAWFLRYGFAFPALILLSGSGVSKTAVIIASLLCIADGVLTEWHFQKRTHAFYCMMQDIMHHTLTPFVHSPGFEKRAEKEGKWLGKIFLILGFSMLLCGIYSAISTFI